ncbi:MAG TPA: class I SAM-dependent methyltransferase [Deltaproteobacteria bacterium]|nr:class I SAM-dependent methyltransferase [Deltaproteobacteria bacterium]
MSEDASRDRGGPSAFFRQHEAVLRRTREIGPVLDLACGRGRHSLAAAALGLDVLALDRDRDSLDVLARQGEAWRSRAAPGSFGRIRTLCADLESGASPPLEADSFGAILVFRYLHRPLCPWIETRLAPGGLLLYETFTRDQRRLGWGPRRNEFLLEKGELPRLFPGLRIERFEEGPSGDEKPAQTARLLARRPG